MAEPVQIVRYVTFAADVPEDHPAVVAARQGRPVDPGLLPWALLGREPDAINGSAWYVLAGSESTRIILNQEK